MEFTSFQTEVNRLHVHFGASDPRKIVWKINSWFEIWNQIYADVSPLVLKKMVDIACRDCERLPPFAEFKGFKNQALSELPKAGFYATAKCSVCDSTGIINAKKDNYSCVFRCHCCENWKGKYDGILLWDSQKHAVDYKIETKMDNESYRCL